MRLNIRETRGFTDAAIQKLINTVQILEQVLNSSEFRDLVLNFSYKVKPGFRFRNMMKEIM